MLITDTIAHTYGDQKWNSPLDSERVTQTLLSNMIFVALVAALASC